MSYKKVNMVLSIILILGCMSYTYIWGSPFQPLPWRPPGSSPQKQGTAIESLQGMGVSAAHPEAVAAGMEILHAGGNAVDAAIAVAFSLGVVQPFDCGIGGGGAMLVYPGTGEAPVVYEYREVAPRSGTMTTGMVGLPGMVKGMETAHQEFGTMPWDVLLEPAVRTAQEGFVVSEHFFRHLSLYQNQLRVTEISHFYPNGKPIQPGRRLIQEDLAATLETIRQQGGGAFYGGSIARNIIRRVPQFSQEDFLNYRVRRQAPVRGMFQDYEIITTGPPLGGVTLIQMLQMMEMAGLSERRNPAEYYPLLTEIMIAAGKDRLQMMGDPDFHAVPVHTLTAREYSWEMVQKVQSSSGPGSSGLQLEEEMDEDGNTTHFVVVDKDGMMVSATHSISRHFGSGIYVDGFFLNNQLRNFSAPHDSINQLEPGKSPRGTIAPTILISPDQKLIGIGAPGGSRIPMILAQVIHNFLAMDMTADQALAEPRIYRLNGLVYIHRDRGHSIREVLRNQGYGIYTYQNSTFFDGVQCIVLDYEQQQMYGAAEPGTDSLWQLDTLQMYEGD